MDPTIKRIDLIDYYTRLEEKEGLADSTNPSEGLVELNGIEPSAS